MRRYLIGSIVLTWLAVSMPGAVATIVPCLFDEGTGQINASTEFGGVRIHLVNGNEIYANSQPCGGATTTTAEEITITAIAGDEVEITLENGPFAPGKTPEGDGSSEIEFEVSGGPVHLTITGSAGADRITAGTGVADTARFNLNAAETVKDADLTLHYDVLLDATVLLGAGPDAFHGGTPGTGEDIPFQAPIEVEGGAGADLLQPGLWPDSGYWGDTRLAAVDDKVDTLTFAWLGDCTVFARNFPLGETETNCGDGLVAFETSFFETLVGHPGEDWFFGASWAEDLRGGGGDDIFIPGRGRDVVTGGAGWDELRVGAFEPVHVDLTARQVFGEGREDFTGIEGVFSTNEGKDVFAGDPPAIIDSVSGGDGANVLDLRTSDHGFTIYASTTVVSGLVTSGLYAQGFLVMGTPFDDTMIGGPNELPSGHDEFRGLGGDDHLEGGLGPDTLLGGDGDDVIRGGAGVDTCAGGAGLDIVSGCEG